MKLGIISTYPPKRCGIGIYTNNLVEAILNSGHTVEVISFKGYEYKDTYVKPFLVKNKFLSYLKSVDYISKNRFDKILIQHEHPFYNIVYFLIFVFLLRLKHQKVNIMMHTIPPYNNLLRRILFIILNSSVMIFSNQIILHTNLAKEKLTKNTLIKRQISVMPIPIKPNRILAKVAEKKKISLVCFGFVHYDKGMDIACEAFAGVKEVMLNIVGTIHPDFIKRQTPYFDKLKTYAKKYKNITVIDRFISEEEKTGLFAENDFVLLPYRFIEQSSVLTVAWAYHKIPICSDIPAFQEEIKNNKYGFLFKHGNPADLRKKVLGLARNKKMQQEILYNITRINRERSFDSISKVFLDMLV